MEVNVFSVYEVSRHLKQVIETQIEELYVSGEVSNFVHHSSGHMYFNLKDAHATLRCTFFRGQNFGLTFKPQDGMQVVCFGKLTVFEKGGSYNLNVKNMSLSGTGNLALQFELLKQKLMQEGLFDSSRKKPLPPHPQRIGIVTSPTGAALQDIKNILVRRYPVEVYVYPALVQGTEAATQIVAGIQYFNAERNVDLIVITRGGGSQEDLFCFNDEGLARAIAKSHLPVVSAVGHEIDFTISDFVADLRAPTPSAAAELIVPDKKDILNHLESLRRRMHLTTENLLAKRYSLLHLQQIELGKSHPEKLLQSYQQRFDMASMQIQIVKTLVHQRRLSFEYTKEKALAKLDRTFMEKTHSSQNKLIEQKNLLENYVMRSRDRLRKRFENMELTLIQQSPKQVLERGYAIVQKDGKILSSIHNVLPEDRLKITVKDGDFFADASN